MFPSQLEPPGLSRNDGKRPDGMTLIPWERGKCLIWDVTCANRLAQSYSSIAKEEGASVASRAEALKREKYSNLNNTYVFQPIATETFGGLGSSTVHFFEKLASIMKKANKEEKSITFMKQRLAIATQVGNAACIMESLKSDQDPD